MWKEIISKIATETIYEKLDRLAKAMDIKINIEECHITLDGDTLYIKGHK